VTELLYWTGCREITMSVHKTKYAFFKDNINVLFLVLFILIFLAGSFVRLHSLNRSLWLDEAWVANSVLTPALNDTFYYGSWLQTSPPLFLIILRCTSNVIRGLPESLRFVPALFGIFSILAMIYLSCKLLKPGFALIATLFFAFSPYLIDQTQSLKQYSSDVFSAVVLLILVHQYLLTRSKKDFYLALLGYIILGFLSYQSIVFIPSILYATIFEWYKTEKGFGWGFRINIRKLEVVLVIACATFVSLINYTAFITPNTNPTIQEFWRSGFLNSFTMHGIYIFYSKTLEIIFENFFFYHENYCFNLVLFVLSVKKLLLFVIILGLIAPIWWGKDNENCRIETNLLLIMPIFFVLILNVFRMYPFGAHTLMLFIFPVFILIFTYGIQCISELFITSLYKIMKIKNFTAKSENIFGIIMFTAFALILAMEIKTDAEPYIYIKPRENVSGAMEYISKNSTENDILYIHSSMREQFKLYANLYPISSDIIIYGNIGWPCCTRENSDNELQSQEQIMSKEINRLKYPKHNYYLRLLFTGRNVHWKYIKRNDPENFKLWLSEIGCVNVASVVRYENIRIDEYICKSTPSGLEK
jgi:hypothetical protein